MSLELILLILRLTGFLLGGGFLYFTLRAYRRHKTRSMLILMIAVALWMIGIVAEGFALQGLGLTIDQSHVLESLVMIVASLFLLLSVLSHRIKEWE
jgi:hypothetical protein